MTERFKTFLLCQEDDRPVVIDLLTVIGVGLGDVWDRETYTVPGERRPRTGEVKKFPATRLYFAGDYQLEVRGPYETVVEEWKAALTRG